MSWPITPNPTQHYMLGRIKPDKLGQIMCTISQRIHSTSGSQTAGNNLRSPLAHPCVAVHELDALVHTKLALREGLIKLHFGALPLAAVHLALEREADLAPVL